jgi:hypothetical protein
MAEEHRRQVEEARALAAGYLSSQGVPGYSAPPPAAPNQSKPDLAVDVGPAQVEPPPSKTGAAVKKGLKQGLVSAGGALLGPVGSIVAGQYNTAENMPEKPAGTPEAPPEAEPAGPPLGPATTEDAPTIYGRYGRGQMVSPAGMYPHSATTQMHMGRPVPEDAQRAFGTSSGLAMQGAEVQHGADRDYYAHVRDAQAARMRATEDAAVQHAAVQAQREAEVKRRLAMIEATNAEASAAIDPNKYWHDRSAGAAVIGAIGVALGGFGDALLRRPNQTLAIIEGGINREIQAQLSNRQVAGQKVARQERLLDLHLQRLGDRDKAIDATKLALWDNVAGQLEGWKAQHGAQMSEANYLNLQSGIMEKRGEVLNKMALQGLADVNRQETEQYRPAQYAGGGTTGGGSNLAGYELIPVPASDRTSERGQLVAVPKDSHKELASMVGATNTIVGINQEALERIKQIRADVAVLKKNPTDTEALQRFNANRKLLEDLGQRKASYISSAEGQGVLKEAEFQRAMGDRVLFTDWYKGEGVVEKRLQGQNNSLTGAASRMIQGAGGQHVRMAYTQGKNGALQPTPEFTGKMYTPPPVGPELGPLKAPKGK